MSLNTLHELHMKIKKYVEYQQNLLQKKEKLSTDIVWTWYKKIVS